MNDKIKELFSTQQYKGVPVITVAQLTEILSAGSSTVRSTLCVHKDKFKEGIHYYKLNGQELLLVMREGVIPVNSAATKLTLLTEEGVKLYFYVKATSHQSKTLPDKQQKVRQSLVTTKTIWSQQPVLTTEQLANFYKTAADNIKVNFNRNQDRFVEGKHYFKLEGQNLVTFKNCVANSYLVQNNTSTLYLWTKRGAARHAKMLHTDKAWEVFEQLDDVYFTAEESMQNTAVEQEQSLVIVSGTRCYVDENQIAWLNAEDVARGLGFVEVKKDRVATSGDNYSTVRWNRVNQYLREFGFRTDVCEKDFIPENMFYRLAMKASNETAQVFQAKVADEILPTLRRTGYYGKQPTMNREEFKQTIAKINQAEEQRVTAIQKVATLRKQLTIAENDLSSLETTIETLYKTVNVSNTPSDINKVIEAAQTVQPLLQDGSYTIGDLHKLVENKMSVSELHDYAKTKGELSDTFNRNRAKLSEEDAAIIMATLGVKLENVSQALLQQTMSFHDVTEKLAALGYTQLQGQNLSASNLLSLLKEQNLPLEEQPHKKGFLIKNNAITKQTFLDLLSFLGKPS